MANRIALRSVNDGVILNYVDDGYSEDDVENPNTRRKRLEYLLKTKAEDGKPNYYAVKPLSGWTITDHRGNRKVFQPLDVPVWGPEQEARHQAIAEQRAARKAAARARVAARVPRTASLATELAAKPAFPEAPAAPAPAPAAPAPAPDAPAAESPVETVDPKAAAASKKKGKKS